MNCLICHLPFESKYYFYSIFFLKTSKDFVCPPCFAKFQFISEKHCLNCYKEGEGDICQDCHKWQNLKKEVHHKALFCYNQAMKDYFSAYKFQGDYLLRKVFIKPIKEALREYTNYTLVPIPLSSSSLENRGFNQVQAFLDEAKLSYYDLLGKEDGSVKQSSKTRQERLKTQQNFYLRKHKELPDKVMLVDDIYTTGMTIQLASQLLRENGVKTIKSFSLAR